jgi:hypothetical protein
MYVRPWEQIILETLGNLGDFIGGIAVVVTLIHLALQIRRESSRSMRTRTCPWISRGE